jgi:hypothetical protein
MRFRKSFGAAGWNALGLAGLFMAIRFLDRQPNWLVTVAPFVFLSLALIKLISRNYIYWELDSSGLHVRKIWGKKEFVVAWDKVIAVRNFIPGVSWDGKVSVYYEPPIPTNGFRYVVTTPERRNEFIAALREFAPHAKFEV